MRVATFTCLTTQQAVLTREGNADPIAARQHDNPGSNGNPIVKIGYVLVSQADAAAGNMFPNGVWIVGAVNSVDRPAKVHRPRAKRVADATRHEARQIGLAHNHF